MQAIELIQRLKSEIGYSARTMNEILDDLCRSDCFDRLPFLNRCNDYLDKMPFPYAWKQAVKDMPQSFDADDCEQLVSLSRILGATDADGQLSALELVEQNLRRNLHLAEQNCLTKGKLYRSMGVLCGIALAIFVI